MRREIPAPPPLLRIRSPLPLGRQSATNTDCAMGSTVCRTLGRQGKVVEGRPGPEALGLVVVMDSRFGPIALCSFERQALWAASARLSGEPAA
jgi:hypothetical protein